MSMPPHTWRAAIAMAAAAVIVAAGCSDDSTAPAKPTVQDYISAVRLTAIGVGEAAVPLTDSIDAVYHDGTLPEESQGPSIGIDTMGAPVRGRTFENTFESFTRHNLKTFYVFVAQGTGYWQITLPESVGSDIYGIGMTVEITMSPHAPLAPFDLRAKATDTLDSTGVTASVRLITTSPDSLSLPEDIVSTLSWTGGSDLDLHIVDPFGHDLSFSSPSTPEGGSLAPDGNGQCNSTAQNHETAMWPARAAPKGTYTVYVVLYHDCGDGAAAPFDLSLQLAGGSVQHVSGTFTGTAAASAPDTVTTFTVR